VLKRSLVTGTVAIVGFLVLIATTELFYFGPPAGAHNAGEVFASVVGTTLTLLTWAVVSWFVARTARVLLHARYAVLIGLVAPVAAIVAFTLTVDLDAWAAGFGALVFAAASAGVLVTLRRSRKTESTPLPRTNGHPPVHMAA